MEAKIWTVEGWYFNSPVEFFIVAPLRFFGLLVIIETGMHSTTPIHSMLAN
jgi:hypothetical protein